MAVVPSARRSGARHARAVSCALAVLTLSASLSACGGGTTATAESTAVVAAPVAATDDLSASEAAGACRGRATVVAPPTVVPIATDSTPVLPTTVTDVTGKAVQVSAAERVLAVGGSGTLATTMYALGLGDRLVGRDQATLIPELADLPVVTVNGHELSGEAILKLDPDLVLADPGAGPPEVIQQLEASGIPVVSIATPPAAGAITPQIREVAAVFGLADLGDQLAERVEGELTAVQQRVRMMIPGDGDRRLRMAFLYLRGASGIYAWLGAGSGADELIRTLDGIDVAQEVAVPARTPLNAEAMAAAQPQLLLLMTRGLQSVGGIDGLRSVAGIGDTEAGRTGCVVDIPDHLALAFGPMYPAVLEALVSAVYERAAPR